MNIDPPHWFAFDLPEKIARRCRSKKQYKELDSWMRLTRRIVEKHMMQAGRRTET